jgi:hypothetical protein
MAQSSFYSGCGWPEQMAMDWALGAGKWPVPFRGARPEEHIMCLLAPCGETWAHKERQNITLGVFRYEPELPSAGLIDAYHCCPGVRTTTEQAP